MSCQLAVSESIRNMAKRISRPNGDMFFFFENPYVVEGKLGYQENFN